MTKTYFYVNGKCKYYISIFFFFFSHYCGYFLRGLVGWLGFTACQPIGAFYAEYVFIYELTLFFMNNYLQTDLFNP